MSQWSHVNRFWCPLYHLLKKFSKHSTHRTCNMGRYQLHVCIPMCSTLNTWYSEYMCGFPFISCMIVFDIWSFIQFEHSTIRSNKTVKTKLCYAHKAKSDYTNFTPKKNVILSYTEKQIQAIALHMLASRRTPIILHLAGGGAWPWGHIYTINASF